MPLPFMFKYKISDHVASRSLLATVYGPFKLDTLGLFPGKTLAPETVTFEIPAVLKA